MLVQLLGPVRLWRDGRPVDPGHAAQRALLALLALAGGQPLSRRELVDGLWPDRPPPPSAANIIQTYVKNLRRLLEPDRPHRSRSVLLPQMGDGYALALPATAVDAAQFRQRIADAARAQQRGQLDHAAELLAAALAQWHGAPLADVPALADHPKALALGRERQHALGRYGEVKVAAGQAAEALWALEEAANGQPLDETAQARLIHGYRAAGRRAQAFATYHTSRHRLADDLGVAPGPELSAAYDLLIREDTVGAGTATGAASTAPAPAELPADVPEFVGRVADLADLDALLAPPARHPTRICVLSGTAGVGKTTLAVHWAHRVAHRFPDGQLYLNLRGFDPSGTAVDPARAARRFLDALRVPAERIPADADSQLALFRSEMSGRRMLLVLDNARDAAQVRPLLPAGPGCVALVTSRNLLADLVGVEGAHARPVDPLTEDEARQLLLSRVGADSGRVGADSGRVGTDSGRVGAGSAAGGPDPVTEILTHCGGLPLALTIVAARAATGGHLSLGALAGQLRDGGERLDALTTGDPPTDLRAVFGCSYRALTPAAGRMFRLLGLHPGPDIRVPAAASLAARRVPEARQLLEELRRANLVVAHRVDRYALHDLLRAYATEVAGRLESRRGRLAATRRVFEHYLHSAEAADALLRRPGNALTLDPPAAGVRPERSAGYDEAFAWFTAERAVLLALVEYAVATGQDGYTWRLARVLGAYLDRAGHWSDLVSTQLAAIAAAQRQDDPSARAAAHRFLARAYNRLGRLDDARVALGRALALYEQTGDPSGQGLAHGDLAIYWERRGRPAEALAHGRRALECYEAAGDLRARAGALNSIGWCHVLLGEYRQALVYCRRALVEVRRFGDRCSEANTLDSLALAHRHLGQLDRARTYQRRSIELLQAVGDRHLEGMVLAHLGDTERAAGDLAAARAAWTTALSILDGIDPGEADRVRAGLAALPGTDTDGLLSDRP